LFCRINQPQVVEACRPAFVAARPNEIRSNHHQGSAAKRGDSNDDFFSHALFLRSVIQGKVESWVKQLQERDPFWGINILRFRPIPGDAPPSTQRQPHFESTSLARFARDLNRPAVRLDDGFGDGQTEAGAAL
jgi:hypothetical protein